MTVAKLPSDLQSSQDIVQSVSVAVGVAGAAGTVQRNYTAAL